jgi:hypothetical protein
MSGRDDIAVFWSCEVDPNCDIGLSMYELSPLSSQLQEITTKDGSTIEMETTAWRLTSIKSAWQWQKIYMTDFNLELLPRLKDDFDRAMEPFQAWCMESHCLMKHASASSCFYCWSSCSSDHCFSSLFKHRPHIIVDATLAPPLYYTARYLFTQIHQDGWDRGLWPYCHRGCQSVIMLKGDREGNEAEGKFWSGRVFGWFYGAILKAKAWLAY